MKKVAKEIKNRAIVFIIIVIARIRIIIYGRKKAVFLVGTPWHGNIGDQAIAFAEHLFFGRNTEKKIIEIPSQFIIQYISIWKKIIKNSTILVHGGGFIGTLWSQEDEMVKEVLRIFKTNRIIILPQSIYFKPGTENSNIEEHVAIFNNCENITFCVREKYSYEFAINSGFKNVYLVPDMVTYITQKDIIKAHHMQAKHNIIMMCLRSDCEKIVDSRAIIEKVVSLVGNKIVYSDTVVQRTIYPFERKFFIHKKLKEFMRAKLVVTDRLHGMVLSAIAGTPCIVLPCCNNKIRGVYDMMSANENIVFISDISSIDQAIRQLLKADRLDLDNKNVQSGFRILLDIIKGEAK